jgi:inorganic pyrophosphatase
VDRPQPYSSQPPALYGFVPRTYCGTRVAALCPGAEKGDGDPLDVCVFSERPINRSEVVLAARVVGGLQTVDRGEADDKIIAVLENDHVWGAARDIGDVPEILVSRLWHYFGTYKQAPGGEPRVQVQEVYGREHAWRVVEASQADYGGEYGE